VPQVTNVDRKGRRLTIHFDDETSLQCDRGFGLAKGFDVGQQIEGLILERVRLEAARHEANLAARRWLRRPHSRAEIAKRLRKIAIPREIIEQTLDEMERHGFLDDRAYAGAWTTDRVRSRPRSARMVRSELRAQGIDSEVAREATADLDDAALALEFAVKRARRYADFEGFSRKEGAALQRRGFGYSDTQQALRDAWAEHVGLEDEGEPRRSGVDSGL
jgi:regulatory protein